MWNSEDKYGILNYISQTAWITCVMQVGCADGNMHTRCGGLCKAWEA